MEMERRGEQSISLSMSRIAEKTTSGVSNWDKGGQIKRDILKLIDCSPLRSISITETSSLLWARLTSHSSLLLG